MKLNANLKIEDALMLDAMQEMRKVYQAEGDVESKSQKIQAIFQGVMQILDMASK